MPPIKRPTPIAAMAATAAMAAIAAGALAIAVSPAAAGDGRLKQGPIPFETPYPDDAAVDSAEMASTNRTFGFWTLSVFEYVPTGQSTAIVGTMQPLSNGDAIGLQFGNKPSDHSPMALFLVSPTIDRDKPLTVSVGDTHFSLTKPSCDRFCAFSMPGKTLFSVLPVSPSKDRLILSYRQKGDDVSVPVILNGLFEAVAAKTSYRTPFPVR